MNSSNNSKCPHGFIIADMAKSKVRCNSCSKEALRIIANTTSFGFLMMFISDMFNFRFTCAAGSLIWGYMRLFNKHDFNPNGKEPTNFYVLGLVKNQKKQ